MRVLLRKTGDFTYQPCNDETRKTLSRHPKGALLVFDLIGDLDFYKEHIDDFFEFAWNEFEKKLKKNKLLEDK